MLRSCVWVEPGMNRSYVTAPVSATEVAPTPRMPELLAPVPSGAADQSSPSLTNIKVSRMNHWSTADDRRAGVGMAKPEATNRSWPPREQLHSTLSEETCPAVLVSTAAGIRTRKTRSKFMTAALPL